MEAKAGDVFCVYNYYLKKYTACQVTKLDDKDDNVQAVVLSLDWAGDQPLSADSLPDMKPLYQDFMYCTNGLHLCNVDPQVPSDYIYVGNIPPLSSESTNTYGGWGNGYGVYRQLRWQEIPEHKRKAFKAAIKSEKQVLIAGKETAVSLYRIDEASHPFENAAELHALPCLSALICEKWHNDLYEYLRDCPFITELSLKNHQQKILDFRQSSMRKLIVDLDGVDELYLNDELEELLPLGNVPETCKIHAKDNGAALLLSAKWASCRNANITDLGKLHSTSVDEIDFTEVFSAYPRLRELRLWGKPGYIRNFAALEKFGEMKRFSTVDMFGFSAADIPAPDKMPNLTWFWMSSLPEDAAKAAKQLYKKRKEQDGLSLWIQKARKPEWLAQNLDNPFRSWDGQENISAAVAKKATAQYRKTRGEILQLIQNPSENLQALAAAAVTAYVDEFNKMDKKKIFIETVEREDIYTALCTILDLIPDDSTVDKDAILEAFDNLRDF